MEDLIITTKECKRCETVKISSDFYSSANRPNTRIYCKQCCSEQTLERQRKFKQMCVDYKGGKCEICSYNKSLGALHFHHKDPSKKDFSISSMKSFSIVSLSDVIINELGKCMLVCSNCHWELHEQINILKQRTIRKDPTTWTKQDYFCVDCGTTINKRSTWCRKCASKNRVKIVINDNKVDYKPLTKIDWPTIEQLLEMLSIDSFSTVAKKLGVSDNAIRKHMQVRNIDPKLFGYYKRNALVGPSGNAPASPN